MTDIVLKSDKVFVLHISHQSGDAFWVFTDLQRANEELATWVKDWWVKELGEPIPDLPDGELITEYFARVIDREYFAIEETTICTDEPQ